jgi:transposase
MGRFVEGADHSQLSFLPECLEDWVDENNAVYVIEVFVEALDLSDLGFSSAMAKATVRISGQC